MIVSILQIVAAIGTILTGFVSLFRPRAIEGFTGLKPTGPRGVTEIRAVLGAFFVGLGGAALYYREPAAYQLLGITYLCVGAVRTVSMCLDKSVMASNIISVIVEIILGVILVLWSEAFARTQAASDPLWASEGAHSQGQIGCQASYDHPNRDRQHL